MKLNRMIAIALGMILMTSVYSCDSTDKESGEEPTPVEKDDDSKGGNDDPAENPADNDPADDDDEYVDFVPYTGPIEPLSDDIRPTYTDGKRWVCDRVDESHPKGTGQYEYQIVGDAVINESVLGSLAYLSEAVYMTSAKKATFTNNKPQYYKEENGVAYLLGTTYIDGCTRYVYHPFWEINPSKSKQVADYYSLGIIVSRGTITLMAKCVAPLSYYVPAAFAISHPMIIGWKALARFLVLRQAMNRSPIARILVNLIIYAFVSAMMVMKRFTTIASSNMICMSPKWNLLMNPRTCSQHPSSQDNSVKIYFKLLLQLIFGAAALFLPKVAIRPPHLR